MSATALATPPLPIEPGDADCSTALFARYVKALALLCECQPYVDEPHFETQLDAVLRDACMAYDIRMQQLDGRFEIALPGSLQHVLGAKCES